MKQKQDKKAIFEQQVKFLKKIAFFNDFDDHELKQLLAVSRWLKVPTGTLIIKEDTMEKVFYILVRGNVSVFITAQDGKTTELTTLTTGATFGEMALVSETKRTAGVKTTSEAYILMVEPDILNQASVFLQLKFYRRFCEILVSRLIAANKRMSDLSSSTKTTAQAKVKSPPTVKPQRAKKEKISPAPKEVEVAKPAPQPPPPVTPQRKIDPSDLPKIPKAQIVARTKLCRRIQSNTDLAINPVVTARLAPFLVGECEDTRKFSELIGCDPMLAAKIIQQANSSFYRRTTDVTSIPHAMITMGIKHLQEVVAEESMKVLPQEESIFGGYEVLSTSFWLHSVVVGRIAELLSETIRLNISEDIYLAGLFHDLGKLAMDQQQKDFYPQLLRPNFLQQPLCDEEKKYMSSDHCQAGVWLGEKMGLPKPYLEVMHFHHHPENAKNNLLLIALVHLADLFAKERGIAMGEDAAQAPAAPLAASFAWILIQEKHPPFIEVNIDDFTQSFNKELDRRWGEISTLIAV